MNYIFKRIICPLLMLLPFMAAAQSGQNYYTHFTDEQLRLDFIFGGDANNQNIYLSGLKGEAVWGGTKNNLVPDFNYGEYRLEVIDPDQWRGSRGIGKKRRDPPGADGCDDA